MLDPWFQRQNATLKAIQLFYWHLIEKCSQLSRFILCLPVKRSYCWQEPLFQVIIQKRNNIGLVLLFPKVQYQDGRWFYEQFNISKEKAVSFVLSRIHPERTRFAVKGLYLLSKSKAIEEIPS
jgi:hypothetical protein